MENKNTTKTPWRHVLPLSGKSIYFLVSCILPKSRQR